MYYNIVNTEPSFPNYLSQEAISILRGLLEKDPQERLGFREGIKELKRSKFLRDINWKRLLKKDQSIAPVPVNLKSINFEPEYISMEPRLSLIE